MQTPLGQLEVKIDDTVLDCTWSAVPTDRACPDLDGRYAIVVPFSPDGKAHILSCRIREISGVEEAFPEPGEDLAMLSFYKGGVKLSIGMEEAENDYDTAYLTDGVQYCLLPTTKTTKFLFGIAWLNAVTEENDIQTWFGADPTLTAFRNAL